MSRTWTPALTLLTITLAGMPAQAQLAPPNPDLIIRAEVERIITTLASDDMRGRQAFSEDAMRAADFLASEFRAAGLQPVKGLDGYLQRFPVRSLAPAEVSVSVAGQALSEDRYLVRMGAESLAWSTGDVEVVAVGPDDELMGTVRNATRGGADALVLVDPSHAEELSGLGRLFRGPVRVVGTAATPSVVVAVSDAEADATYEVSATATVTEQPLANVVGVLPGRRSDEYVLFSGHYDHLGIRRPVDGDSIANGANDDASGTTAVVALARYFASRGTPERTLLFAAFTAEEVGGYGSRYFSEQLDPDEIVAMFNIEMIGKPATEGPNTAWITGFERSSFGTLLQAAVEGTEYTFYPDPYPNQNLFYRSDNATLARLGVPAHSISTTPIDVDPDYHQVSDEVGTLDLDHMTHTIRAIAMGAESIISGRATPTRVDPATVNR